MTLLEHYQQAIASHEFIADPIQEKALLHLQRVYEDYLQRQHANKSKWRRVLNQFNNKKYPLQGLYLWGGVGSGKTWLMDTFYNCLPSQTKMRMHFHRFMRRIHHDLKELQGHIDPLKIIAKRFSKEIDILCFDEFFVSDITDAMLLANLFQALFNEGITLVATSNVSPDELYRNGLQRNLFLPAIELIKKHTEVLHMQTQVDYRLRELKKAGTYFYPLNENSTQHMRDKFEFFSRGQGMADELLMIEGRPIPTVCCADDIVWFDFADLCHVPRSQMDYIEISQLYHTVLLSNVPQILPEQDNLTVYLINLVDVFYDANVNLIISAAVPVEAIYSEGRYRFEFKRTQSRLLEMQSEEYWVRERLFRL